MSDHDTRESHKPKPPRLAMSDPSRATRCADSRDLLGPGGVLTIHHDGERYVLRRTRNGRLILTK